MREAWRGRRERGNRGEREREAVENMREKSEMKLGRVWRIRVRI